MSCRDFRTEPGARSVGWTARREAASFNKGAAPTEGGRRQFPIRTPLAARVGELGGSVKAHAP